jgi:cation transport ATPase
MTITETYKSNRVIYNTPALLWKYFCVIYQTIQKMMTHQYKLTGLTCSGCVAKVKSALLSHPDVLSAEVTRESAILTMDRHIELASLREQIGREGKYGIEEESGTDAAHQHAGTSADTSWLKTYKPLLLIAAFITGVSFLTAYSGGELHWMMWMNHFMAGFFIVFSFFKMLDLRGFADSYAMYDLLAKRWKGYGFVYPFIELALGAMYLTGFDPAATAIATVVVMGFSAIGVIKSVLSKQQIRCACLGAVFNLPMSTVTIVEDLLMAGMAVVMFINMV